MGDQPLRLLNPSLREDLLVRVIEGCLALDPARQFQSMQSVDAALANLQHTSTRPG